MRSYPTSTFSAADATDPERYICANADGTFPGDSHTQFGLAPREFADRSGLRMRMTADGRAIDAWVRGAKPKRNMSASAPKGKPATPQELELITLAILEAKERGDEQAADTLVRAATDADLRAKLFAPEPAAHSARTFSDGELRTAMEPHIRLVIGAASIGATREQCEQLLPPGPMGEALRRELPKLMRAGAEWARRCAQQ